MVHYKLWDIRPAETKGTIKGVAIYSNGVRLKTYAKTDSWYPSMQRAKIACDAALASIHKELYKKHKVDAVTAALYENGHPIPMKKFKVTAIIHPKNGGDDYIINGMQEAFSLERAKKVTEAYLKRRSAVIDYKISEMV